MKKSYKCTCCQCWYDNEKDVDHISFSTKEGNLQVYIKCKNCKKKECLSSCKYMPVNN